MESPSKKVVFVFQISKETVGKPPGNYMQITRDLWVYSLAQSSKVLDPASCPGSSVAIPVGGGEEEEEEEVVE